MQLVLRRPVYLLLPLALIFVFIDVVFTCLVSLGTGDFVRRLHVHPFELSEAVGHSLFLSRHHFLEVHVGLRDLLSHPLVRQFLLIERFPVFALGLEMLHEKTFASGQILVHPARINQFHTERLIVALSRVIVAWLWHITSFFVLVSDFVPRLAFLVLFGEGECVRLDVVRRILRPFSEDHVRFGVPEGALEEVASGAHALVSLLAQVKRALGASIVEGRVNELLVFNCY